MPTRIALSILLSVTLSGCFETFLPTKPVGVPFNLPPNLRQCEAGKVDTKPETFLSVGDLLNGYGTERTGRLEERECHRETVRLIDVHNEQMTTGRLGPTGSR